MRNIIVDKRMLFWELDVSLACPRISVPDAMKGLVNGKGMHSWVRSTESVK
jgi:hypothetical protein